MTIPIGSFFNMPVFTMGGDITYINSVSGQVSSYHTSYNLAAMTVAAGDLVVVMLCKQLTTMSISSIVDDASTPNTYTVAAVQGSGNGLYQTMAYCFITTSKTDAIITVTYTDETNDVSKARAIRFTKAAGKTWYTDYASDGEWQVNYASTATTKTRGTDTGYADGVTVGGVSANSPITWSGYTINDTVATLAPSDQPNPDNYIVFYRLHGVVSGNHADATMSGTEWYGATIYTFGAN